jgi:hypothetical protein
MPLPRALKGRFVAKPKWVDLAAHRDGADKRDAKFTELAADFAAAIRGMPKEDLLSQEVRQQRRRALSLAIPTFRAKIPRDSAAHASGRRPRYRGCRNGRPGADLSRIQRRRTRGGREGPSPAPAPGRAMQPVSLPRQVERFQQSSPARVKSPAMTSLKLPKVQTVTSAAVNRVVPLPLGRRKPRLSWDWSSGGDLEVQLRRHASVRA